MANLKQILQSNNTKIANAINEQNSQIKNYIDNKDNDTIESAKRYADNLKKISGTNASMGITEDGYGIEISSDLNTTIKSIGTESSISLNAPHITVSQSPTNDNEIANKQYIDKQIMELGTAAYTNTENYDPAGSANLVKIELIGSTTNTATDNTIYGVKKYVDEQVAKIPDDVITEDKLVEKGYLVTIPDEYITETELKSELSEYAKLDDISPDGDIVIDTDWDSIKNKPTIYPTNWENVEGKPTNLATTDDLNDYLKTSTNNWSFENSTVNIAPLDQVKILTNNDNADGISINSANVLSLSGKSSISISTDENCLMQFQNYSISLNSSQGISLSGGSAVSLSSPKIILNGNEELHLQIKSNNLISLSPNGINLGGFFDGGQINLSGSITFAKSPLGGQGSIFYLYSPDGNKWEISIDNDGDITTNKITA